MGNLNVFSAILDLPDSSEMKYRFYEVKSGIFLVEVDGNEDLGLMFLRAQEFYESVNPNIQGNKFNFDEYKSWYMSQSETGGFTYGEDWLGFNLPGQSIEECYRVNNERTIYDERFLKFCNLCAVMSQEKGLDNYYILGVRNGDIETLDHELAHGLFTVNSDYKKEVMNYVNNMHSAKREYLYDWLTKKGYASSVHDDEIQAFLSTGIHSTMDEKLLLQDIEFFQSLFKKYNGSDANMSPLVNTVNFSF